MADREGLEYGRQSETLIASGCLTGQSKSTLPLSVRIPVRFVRSFGSSHFGTSSVHTRKPSSKHFLVADSIISCEYQSLVYAIRLLSIRDLPRSIGMQQGAGCVNHNRMSSTMLTGLCCR